MTVITLTTDLGLRDHFVGVMKGVILGINPDAVIVDLAHELPPHDIKQAAFSLLLSIPFFSPGTIHVAVIDPGVGSDRGILAVRTADRCYVAPDNGLLTYVLEHKTFNARRIENPSFMRPEVSRTFHGRDIMAPAAAWLSAGRPFEEIGPAVDSITMFASMETKMTADSLSGRIMYADRFGNLITNISAASLKAWGHPRELVVGRVHLKGLADSYASAPSGSLLALEGSHGFIEIARNMGRADSEPGVAVGISVTLLK